MSKYGYASEYQGEETMTFEIEDTTDKIKIFVWDSFESMKPLCEAVTIEAK